MKTKLFAPIVVLLMGFASLCAPLSVSAANIDAGTQITGCKYTNAGITTATADTYFNIQCDSTGHVLTTGSGGGGPVAPTNAGTSATTANPVQGVTGGVPLPVSGTFYQTTQPISGTVTSNAGTGYPTLYSAGGAVSGSNVLTVQGASGGVGLPVTGTFYQATQPVSGTVSLSGTSPVSGTVTSNAGTGFPGPTAPGTSATGSNVLTIQGSSSGVAVPISGTVTSTVGSAVKTGSVLVSPTVSTSAYVAGYDVGGLLTFSSVFAAAASGQLSSIYITTKDVQTAGFKLYIFKANPTNSTWTDHAAPAINAADIPNLVGVYVLAAPDSGLGTVTVYNLDGIGKSIATGGGSTLYGILVTTGTPTFASTSDISINISTIQD